jgi:cell wall-associated NlpC family hydrolase
VADRTGVHPVKTMSQMLLSPGGQGSLATLAVGQTAVTLGWGAPPLSPPALDGNRAVYPDAVPGGDLVVTANDIGFKVSVVLRHDPGVSVLVGVPFSLRGLVLTERLDSQFELLNPVGQLVARWMAPTAVGSARDSHSGFASQLISPDTALVQTATGPEMLVHPDPSWLAQPGLSYPVTMDLATIYPPSIPVPYADLYRQAAASCFGLPWTVLAAIGAEESNHGQSTARGVQSGANSAGAQGPMQFLPSTFSAYDHPVLADPTPTPVAPGTSLDPPSPYDPTAAVYATARDLCANGGGNSASLAGAVFAYNHAGWYVNAVLTQAMSFAYILPPATSPAGMAAQYALSALGIPYRSGADGPGAFDSSGLTQSAYLAAGISLPQGAQDQYNAHPRPLASEPSAPGELMFFGQSKTSVSHVGIYLGDTLMIDAPYGGAQVRIESDRWPVRPPQPPPLQLLPDPLGSPLFPARSEANLRHVTPNPASGCAIGSSGAAMPLPDQWLHGGSIDQGVDYPAPGGTPLCAMGDGMIIGEGIGGFGPSAPILQITSGPLAGRAVYYGHAGPDVVPVGAHVANGQQISSVGYGIVGISTGPHLEIGFYPPGAVGAGSPMLSYIDSQLGVR